MGVGLFCQLTSDRTKRKLPQIAPGKFRMDSRIFFFSPERVAKHWKRLTREAGEPLSLQVKDVYMWHSATWFSGGLGNDGLKVELDDLRGFFPTLMILFLSLGEL